MKPVLVVILLSAGGFLFALSEAVLLAGSRFRWRHQGTPREVFLALAVIAWSVVFLVAVAVTTWAWHLLGGREAVLAGSAGMLAVVLLLREVVRKSLPAQPAVPVLRVADAFLRLMLPVARTALRASDRLLRWCGIEARPAAKPDDELHHLVELSAETGVLAQQESELIRDIIGLGDTVVREIMVPRTDLVLLPADATLARALEGFESSRRSRIPLFEETVDHIVGVLFIKDLFTHLHVDPQHPVRPWAREPLVVPETQRVDRLFREMRAQRRHLAVVVDEFGGTAGLVSIEDILEELVGEIVDEHDRHAGATVRRLDPHTALVDARAHVEDVNSALGLTLPHEPAAYDTVGGFVLDRLGRLPRVGDSIAHEQAILSVEQMRGRRIVRVRITGGPHHQQENEAGS